MKKIKLSILALLTLFISSSVFISCSSEDDKIELEPQTTSKFYEIATNNEKASNLKQKSELKLDLYKENSNDNFVKGNINFENQSVNVKMNLTENGLIDTNFTLISENKISIENLNGYNYILNINNVNENNAQLTFEVENKIINIDVAGSIDTQEFIDLSNNNGKFVQKRLLCGGLCVGAIVTIVGGAYCAWRTTSLASACVDAYNTCGAGCSYEFESNSCGGDCTITPN